jgi:PAS domain S-box-containing protein
MDAALSPELLTQLLNTTDCAVVVLDATQTIRYVNDAVTRVFGYAPAELIGHSIDLLLPESSVSAHRQHVRDFCASMHVAHSENMVHRKPVHGRRKNDETFLAMIGISTLIRNGQQWCAAIVNDLTTVVNTQAELRTKTEAMALMAERARLARIFQDITSQTLFSAKISAEILPKVIRRDQDEAIRMAEAISRMAAGAMAQLRIVLVELHEGEIAANPIESLIKLLADASAARIGFPISVALTVRGQPPEPVRVTLYRVAQEALHNAVSHSAAERIDVDLYVTPNLARLIVTDNGRGTAHERLRTSRAGVQAMREHAAQIDAHLDIWSAAGQGTRVSLAWPVIRPV